MMFRRLSALTMAVTLALITTNPAAAGRPAASAHHGVAAVSGKIVWWSHNNPAFVAQNKALVQAFEKQYPNIQVVYQDFPYDVFIKKLITAYASHTQPDVAQMFGTWVTAYAKAGQLDPVPSWVMPPATITKTFWPAALGAYQWQGQYYGLPHEYNLENGGLLINTQQWKQAGLREYPRTWAELTADAKKLTRYDSHGNVTRAGLSTMDFNDDAVFMPFSMLLQQGGAYFAKDGVHVNLTSPAMIKAVTAYTDWYLKDKVATYSLDHNGIAFEQGRAAMAFDGPWVIPLIKASYPKLPFVYVQIPSYTSTPPYFAAESGWGEVVARASTNKEAAWTFVRYLSTQQTNRSWNIATGTVPARRDLYDDPKYLATLPGIKTSFHVLRYGRWIGNLQNRDQFFTIMAKWITAIELHKASVAPAMASCQSEENKMIDSYVQNF